MVDSGFEIRAYFWLLMWYFFFVFDAVSQRPYFFGTACVRKHQQHHVPSSGF